MKPFIKSLVMVLCCLAANGGSLRADEVLAPPSMEIQLDERLIKDAFEAVWISKIEPQVGEMIRSQLTGGAYKSIVKRINIKFSDLYSHIQFSGAPKGLELVIDAPVDVSFLPYASGAFSRIHVQGPLHIQTQFDLVNGALVLKKPQMSVDLKMSCQWFLAPALCELMRKGIDPKVDTQVQHLANGMQDTVLLNEASMSTVLPLVNRTVTMSLLSIGYVAPTCVAPPKNYVQLPAGWIDLKIGIQLTAAPAPSPVPSVAPAPPAAIPPPPLLSDIPPAG